MSETKMLGDGTECTQQVIKNPHSETTRLALRNAKGMFARRVTRLPSAKRITEAIVAKMVQCEEGETPKLEQVVDAMFTMSQNEDPKCASAAVKASELILKTVCPKEAVDQKQQINIVINAPTLMYPEVIDGDAVKPKLRPSFIDAEVITNEEP